MYIYIYIYIYRERFSKELECAIHGTVKASPDEFGETLEGEQLRGGSFLEQDQIQVLSLPSYLPFFCSLTHACLRPGFYKLCNTSRCNVLK
jgi:hypothetical protein